jgi:hypothetical protein
VKYVYRCTALVFVLMLFATAANAQCASGTVTAEFQTTGPHTGLWKYTVDVSWDLPQGISNLTLDCGFSCNPELACVQIYEFDSPSGTAGECTVVDGQFNCEGNPSIGFTDPILKWDFEECDTPVGSAILCFYTNIGPVGGSSLPVTLIKNGQSVCVEELTGDCPALCPVPTEHLNWGVVKDIYKK